MKTKPSRAYSLIPSVRDKTGVPGVVSFVPALPVHLLPPHGLQMYGVVDTTAKIGTISTSTLERLQAGVKTRDERGLMHVELSNIVKLGVVICDSGFRPWLRMTDVPFAVVAEANAGEIETKLTLGFDSCLEHLDLTIDYPRRMLTVRAARQLASEKTQGSGSGVSSRIREGEQLIKLGSYRAGITMLAAGLEELAMDYLPQRAGSNQLTSNLPSLDTWGQLRGLFRESEELSPKLRQHLNLLINWRNQAVHGSEKWRMTERDAKRAIIYVRELTRWLLESPPSMKS